MKREKLAASGDLILKAVIICDDLDFVAAATAALERVGRRERVNARWAVKYWPANALNEITMAESLDAHLIMFPAWHARNFPLWLRNWLERWAELRQIKEAALGVIAAGNPGGSVGTFAELTKFILQHGLHFVGEESSVANDRRRIPVTFQASHGKAILLPVR